jgi:acyl-CoA thioester hydrolase
LIFRYGCLIGAINLQNIVRRQPAERLLHMSHTFDYSSQVYFDELDGLGLLHHTRYLLHLERAQQKLFEQLLGVADFNADRDEDIYVVVHSLTARFRQPVSCPGPISVRYTIQKIRSGGVTMGYTIGSPQHDTIYCEGERTVCKLSAITHRPAPWTEPFRDAMQQFQATP